MCAVAAVRYFCADKKRKVYCLRGAHYYGNRKEKDVREAKEQRKSLSISLSFRPLGGASGAISKARDCAGKVRQIDFERDFSNDREIELTHSPMEVDRNRSESGAGYKWLLLRPFSTLGLLARFTGGRSGNWKR